MDKMIACFMIAFFILCACLITWGMVTGRKRNLVCKLMAFGYTAVSWICVIALVVMTIIYKDL